MDVMFCYGTRRVVTSIVDKNGERVIGSEVSDAIVEKVLKDGKPVFSQKVSVVMRSPGARMGMPGG